ncbi:MAG: hypothetical protein ACEY3H_07170, partial [Wolbachia sp.]
MSFSSLSCSITLKLSVIILSNSNLLIIQETSFISSKLSLLVIFFSNILIKKSCYCKEYPWLHYGFF